MSVPLVTSPYKGSSGCLDVGDGIALVAICFGKADQCLDISGRDSCSRCYQSHSPVRVHRSRNTTSSR